MNINKFAEKITKHEGLKKQVNIAQVKEILRVINILTAGFFYKYIKYFINEKNK